MSSADKREALFLRLWNLPDTVQVNEMGAGNIAVFSQNSCIGTQGLNACFGLVLVCKQAAIIYHMPACGGEDLRKQLSKFLNLIQQHGDVIQAPVVKLNYFPSWQGPAANLNDPHSATTIQANQMRAFLQQVGLPITREKLYPAYLNVQQGAAEARGHMGTILVDGRRASEGDVRVLLNGGISVHADFASDPPNVRHHSPPISAPPSPEPVSHSHSGIHAGTAEVGGAGGRPTPPSNTAPKKSSFFSSLFGKRARDRRRPMPPAPAPAHSSSHISNRPRPTPSTSHHPSTSTSAYQPPRPTATQYHHSASLVPPRPSTAQSVESTQRRHSQVSTTSHRPHHQPVPSAFASDSGSAAPRKSAGGLFGKFFSRGGGGASSRKGRSATSTRRRK